MEAVCLLPLFEENVEILIEGEYVGGQPGENDNGTLVEATGSRLHLSTCLSEVIILIGQTNLAKTGL